MLSVNPALSCGIQTTMAFKICLLSALVAIVHGGVVAPVAPVAHVAISAKLEDSEFDPNPQYTFAYDVQDAITGDNKRQFESRSGDVVQGQYSLVDPDGTQRIVDYTADPINGFNAVVSRTPLVARVVAAQAPVVAEVAAPLVAAPVVAKVAAPARVIAPAPVVAAARFVAPAAAPARFVAPAPILAPAQVLASRQYVAHADQVYERSPLVAAGPVAYSAKYAAPVAQYAAPVAQYAAPVAYSAQYAAPIGAPVAYNPYFAQYNYV